MINIQMINHTLHYIHRQQSKEKAVKPEEVAAQYDSLMSLAHDMTELAGEVCV